MLTLSATDDIEVVNKIISQKYLEITQWLCHVKNSISGQFFHSHMVSLLIKSEQICISSYQKPINHLLFIFLCDQRCEKNYSQNHKMYKCDSSKHKCKYKINPSQYRINFTLSTYKQMFWNVCLSFLLTKTKQTK